MIVRKFLRWVDGLIGWQHRLSNTVSVGEGTRLQWRRLQNISGNELRIGSHSIVNANIAFEAKGGLVSIGDRCFIGRSDVACYREIRIGDDVIISWGVTLVDHNSHGIDWTGRSQDVAEWRSGRKNWSNVMHAPITIEDKVWIGFKASILKGVTIGEGAVIGACSVVTKDIPSYSVAVGNPAKVIRFLKAAGDE